MKHTTYRELCDSVFPKIKDFDLASMTMEQAYDIIVDYMSPAITMFEGCTQDLTDRDDELGEFNFTLTDDNFEMLSNYMVICYLDSNYIRTQTMLKSYLSNSDFAKYDNKDVLNRAIEVRNMYKSENDQLMINHSISASQLYQDVVNRRKRGGI